MSAQGSGLVPRDHPDRIRWNAKYGTGFVPSFRPHPLAARALALGLPDGPVADLACGPSGAALLAAEQGRRVTAVDVSEVALGLLGAEAGRRGLGHLITLVHADLSAWAPEPRSYALVLGIGFWDAAVFRGRGRRGGGRRPAGLGGPHRRSPPEASRPAAGILRRPGRARLASARRLQRPRPERCSPPRPPLSAGPPAPLVGICALVRDPVISTYLPRLSPSAAFWAATSRSRWPAGRGPGRRDQPGVQRSGSGGPAVVGALGLVEGGVGAQRVEFVPGQLVPGGQPQRGVCGIAALVQQVWIPAVA